MELFQKIKASACVYWSSIELRKGGELKGDGLTGIVPQIPQTMIALQTDVFGFSGRI